MSFTLTQNLKSFRTIPYLNLVEPLSAAPVAVTYTAKGVDSIYGTTATVLFDTQAEGLEATGQLYYSFEFTDLATIFEDAETALKKEISE
ncbi:TPA: hypothetical protein MFD83_002357 [Klebsiella pneumoniae]|uniref:hypothetical protein n=1 Tax=Klebsiella pneumoniae TaxID=573 RepID=UPI0014641AF8|nr:hypothetical protein [Klebsiella pneumoniae]MDK7268713.1 hypothetical protein [Klebsiella pneumoniae]QJK92137.1 hypothetical protein HJX19_14610 [Klebsiella pneumoniae]QJM05277.1 hypothetical protein HJW80_14680 [Klebsiella pneumoniae]HBT3061253.1 hypothetical protein [Klebsiella pneumoniae]HBW7569418.1 hypothetical protein [Klebsiella pneumoniae]